MSKNLNEEKTKKEINKKNEKKLVGVSLSFIIICFIMLCVSFMCNYGNTNVTYIFIIMLSFIEIANLISFCFLYSKLKNNEIEKEKIELKKIELEKIEKINNK